MVLPDSARISRVRPYSGKSSRELSVFAYRTITFCGLAFQTNSANGSFFNSVPGLNLRVMTAHNPGSATRSGLTHYRFGLFPFRSPLLRESRLLSLPGGTKMFQFSPFAFPRLCIHPGNDCQLRQPGCPIRESPGQRLFAPHRSLSQLITPFIAY